MLACLIAAAVLYLAALVVGAVVAGRYLAHIVTNAIRSAYQAGHVTGYTHGLLERQD